jgi:hypothetical protein
MRANLEAELSGISPDQFVDRIGGERLFQEADAVVADRTEQRAVVVSNIAGGVAPGDNLRPGLRCGILPAARRGVNREKSAIAFS